MLREIGISIFGEKTQGFAANNNKINKNFIGKTMDSDTGSANGSSAISIRESSGNVIGGENREDMNDISTNNDHGIAIFDIFNGKAMGNKILSNGIHIKNRTIDSRGLGAQGIFLGNGANDDKDSDKGANNGQNSPELITAEMVNFGDNLEVVGTLNSEVGKIYNLQFFKESACESELIYEYIGQITTEATDQDGNVDFIYFTEGEFATVGDFISATATDPDGNTSEISFPCVKVVER